MIYDGSLSYELEIGHLVDDHVKDGIFFFGICK